MLVTAAVVHLRLPGCSSLKEKRARLRGPMAKLGRAPGLAIREVGDHDLWGNATLGVASLGQGAEEAVACAVRIFEELPDVTVEAWAIETWSTG